MGNKQSHKPDAKKKIATPLQSKHPPLTQRAALEAMDYSAASYDHRCGPYQWNSGGGYSLKLPETGFSTSISGYLLGSQPQPFSMYLNCVRCGESCYDGGQCKIVICSCGIAQQRDCDNKVVIADKQDPTLFKNMFLKSTEASIPYSELQTLTLGLFVEQAPDQVNFDHIIMNTLIPYFSFRQRCISKDDCFNVGHLKFKAMACYPSTGLVNAGTQIQCYTTLQTQALSRVHILPLRPSSIDERTLNRKILPYMQQHTVHLHREQTLRIAGVKLIVMASEPANGVVTNATELFFAGEPLSEIRQFSVTAHSEHLPPPLHRLNQEQLKDTMYHMYLMPYFVGWSRIIQTNQTITIDGIQITVQTNHSGLGVVAETSRIIYDGSVMERSMPALITQSLRSFLGVRPNSIRSSGDPRIDLLQHILFIQQLLSSMEHREEDAGTSSNIISQLPVYKLTSIPSSDDRKRCMVCIDDFEVGVEVKTLPCFHVFHTECIDEWLGRSKLCPVCKTPSDRFSA
mmetsp:Transcript_28844/g.51373  ORF Transcript_28844/g.51373 Transcript_28844/m.51373 type:complete len:514 (+) Transcript_28844:1047-2588(+)